MNAQNTCKSLACTQPHAQKITQCAHIYNHMHPTMHRCKLHACMWHMLTYPHKHMNLATDSLPHPHSLSWRLHLLLLSSPRARTAP